MEDIEAIKIVMARYFRFMDTKQWDELRSLFAEDMSMWAPDDVPGAEPLRGATRVARTVERVLGPSISVHRGHTPEISLVGPDDAQGIWAMDDTVDFPDDRSLSFAGSGHYFASYVRQGGSWKIHSLTLRRLKLDRPRRPPSAP